MFVRQQIRALLRALPLSCNHMASGEEQLNSTTINECNLFCPFLLTSISWLCFPLLSLAVPAECWNSCPGFAVENCQCWSFLGKELGTCQSAGPDADRGCSSCSVMSHPGMVLARGAGRAAHPNLQLPLAAFCPSPGAAALCPPGQQGTLSHPAGIKPSVSLFGCKPSNNGSEAPTRGGEIRGRTTVSSCLWSCLD